MRGLPRPSAPNVSKSGGHRLQRPATSASHSGLPARRKPGSYAWNGWLAVRGHGHVGVIVQFREAGEILGWIQATASDQGTPFSFAVLIIILRDAGTAATVFVDRVMMKHSAHEVERCAWRRASRAKRTQRMVQQRSRLSVPQLCAHRLVTFRKEHARYKGTCDNGHRSLRLRACLLVTLQ